MTSYGPDRLGIESRCGHSFLCPSRLAPRPTQPAVQWVLGLSQWYIGLGMMLTTHAFLMPGFAGCCGAVIPPSICAYVGTLRGDLYLYLYLSSASCHITFLHSCLENCITFVLYPAYTEDLYFRHISPYIYTLRYDPESRGFNSRWCHWNFSLS